MPVTDWSLTKVTSDHAGGVVGRCRPPPGRGGGGAASRDQRRGPQVDQQGQRPEPQVSRGREGGYGRAECFFTVRHSAAASSSPQMWRASCPSLLSTSSTPPSPPQNAPQRTQKDSTVSVIQL